MAGVLFAYDTKTRGERAAFSPCRHEAEIMAKRWMTPVKQAAAQRDRRALVRMNHLPDMFLPAFIPPASI